MAHLDTGWHAQMLLNTVFLLSLARPAPVDLAPRGDEDASKGRVASRQYF
jgi:hypothetical protein